MTIIVQHKKARTFIIFLLLVAGYSGIAMRIYYVAIRDGSTYAAMGQQQYYVTLTTYPPRAHIVDRHGQPLAINREGVSAFVTPATIHDRRALERFLQEHYPHAYTRLHNAHDHHSFFIQRMLTDEQYACIRNAASKDIHLVNEPGRYYPLPVSAPIVGITNSDGKGICGLELFFNEQLAGKPMVQHLWKDAHSGVYTLPHQLPEQGVTGTALVTSVDTVLQFLANEELLATMREYQAREGAVIIVDPATGEVLAMVSQPWCDPHDRVGLELEYMNNRIVHHQYELGSVIKVCSALAALEEGVVQPDELIDCQGVRTTYINGRKVNTAKKTEAGLIPFSRVIERSNNIGIAQVALRLGDQLYAHYQRMGFDRLTGIELPGERSGFINPPHTWSKQSVISLSYGYEIASTLAQLARFFCMIARDGHDLRLTLLKQPAAQQGERTYSHQSIDTMRTILENTTLHGTTYRARIKGYTIMSKSGTANMLVDGQYTPDKGTFTCAGIIQKGDYQRVMVVFIKEAVGQELFASVVAAPLFERIAQKILIHDKILI